MSSTTYADPEPSSSPPTLSSGYIIFVIFFVSIFISFLSGIRKRPLLAAEKGPCLVQPPLLLYVMQRAPRI